MEITSKIRDFENKVYLDKIAISIRYLSSTTDIPLFIKQMVSLSALLSNYDRNLDNPFPVIDENNTRSAYFIVYLLDTKNIAESIWVYRLVRSLTRYILLSIDSMRLEMIDTLCSQNKCVNQ